MKTILCIDIDGVLNAFSTVTTLERATGWTNWKHFSVHKKENPDFFKNESNPQVKSYHITYSLDLLKELERLSKDPNIEIQYLTTWGDYAHTVFAKRTKFDTSRKWKTTNPFNPLSLFSKDNIILGSWWKHHYVYELARENPDKQVIFLDDDILDKHASERNVVSREIVKHVPNVILAHVDLYYGLTKKNLATIEDYTNQNEIQSELLNFSPYEY